MTSLLIWAKTYSIHSSECRWVVGFDSVLKPWDALWFQCIETFTKWPSSGSHHLKGDSFRWIFLVEYVCNLTEFYSPDDTFRFVILEEYFCNLTGLSLMFIHGGAVDRMSSLFRWWLGSLQRNFKIALLYLCWDMLWNASTYMNT